MKLAYAPHSRVGRDLPPHMPIAVVIAEAREAQTTPRRLARAALRVSAK